MGYRGGPTPRGEQGPSFYYPGSHDGSQPWPNLILSHARLALPSSRFAPNAGRAQHLLLAVSPRESSKHSIRVRTPSEEDVGIMRMRARFASASTEEQRRQYLLLFSFRAKSTVTRMSERARHDGCDGKCEKCSITV